MTSSAQTSFIAAFADELRRAREYKQISLSDVVQRTRIAREYLEALEQGSWEAIPSPYLRGYLHLYAQAAGMNVEKVLQSFDELIRSRAAQESARLDSDLPLLKQPEHVGVTRAKIRAAWFASLMNNRRYAYATMAISLAVLTSVLYFSRKSQRPHVYPAAFTETVNEYRRTLRGPLTVLDIPVADSSAKGARSKSESITLYAQTDGRVRITGHNGLIDYLNFHPFDTLVINYKEFIYIAVAPHSSAKVISSAGDTLSPYLTIDEATFFRSGDDKMTLPDDSVADSLLIP